ncbi:MAG: hypothetical protein K2X46_00635 [Roseomonas sp.]|nr:hypothetical protein [Roseomonas sp.]
MPGPGASSPGTGPDPLARFLPAWLPLKRRVANDDTPAPEGKQHTGRNALIMVALMLGGLLVASQVFRGGWTAGPTEMERYVRSGARIGAQELERDLRAAHPPGSEIGPLFGRLSRFGFTCGAPPVAGAAVECRYRARRDDNRLISVTLDVAHDGVRVQAIAARMAVTNP